MQKKYRHLIWVLNIESFLAANPPPPQGILNPCIFPADSYLASKYLERLEVDCALGDDHLGDAATHGAQVDVEQDPALD